MNDHSYRNCAKCAENVRLWGESIVDSRTGEHLDVQFLVQYRYTPPPNDEVAVVAGDAAFAALQGIILDESEVEHLEGIIRKIGPAKSMQSTLRRQNPDSPTIEHLWRLYGVAYELAPEELETVKRLS